MLNDGVFHAGSSYRSLIDGNAANQPDASPAAWALIAQGGSSGGGLTPGSALSQNFTGPLFTFQNTTGVTNGHAALRAIAGNPTITMSTPPMAIGMTGPYNAGLIGAGVANGVGIYGFNAGSNGVAIWGSNTATGNSNSATAVLGTSSGNNARAIMGLASSTGTGTATGVHGESAAQAGSGVVGRATNSVGASYGVQGSAVSSGGYGVFGWNDANSGNAAGVYGRGKSPDGYGVYGSNTSTTSAGIAAGVYGATNATGSGSPGLNQFPSAAVFGYAGSASGVVGYSGIPTGAGNPSGRVHAGGVYGYTGSPDGTAVYSLGRMVIDNTAASGAQTSGTDALVAWCENNGAAGINADAQMFANSFNLVSDRNRKENFQPVHPVEILRKAAALPLSTWNFKGDSATSRHLGPMAQDFHAAFGLNGGNDKQIGSGDMDGILLASVQALNQLVSEQNVRIAQLEIKLAQSESTTARLESRLEELEKRVPLVSAPAAAGMGLGLLLIAAPIAALAKRRGRREQ